jgi:signal transduction histidine kinase
VSAVDDPRPAVPAAVPAVVADVTVRPADALHALRHDLRAPLVLIDGFAQLLAEDRELDDALRRQCAERIRAAAAELRSLVDAAVVE